MNEYQAITLDAAQKGLVAFTGPKQGHDWKHVAIAKARAAMRRLRAKRKANGMNQDTGKPRVRHSKHPTEEARIEARRQSSRKSYLKKKAKQSSAKRSKGCSCEPNSPVWCDVCEGKAAASAFGRYIQGEPVCLN